MYQALWGSSRRAAPWGEAPTCRAGHHCEPAEPPALLGHRAGRGYPGLPQEPMLKFCIIKQPSFHPRCVRATWGCARWAGVPLQAGIPLPPREHPCPAPILTLMLQKILLEQVLELLGMSTGDLPTSGWTPMARASRGARNCWAARGLPPLSAPSRLPQPARTVPKSLQGCE